MNKDIKVIGIDPGSQNMGWGIVQESSGVLKLVACGIIRPKAKEFSLRLGEIFSELIEILKLHKVDEASVEDIFTHKNVSSALKLGQARGVAIAACALYKLPVYSFEPRVIKKNLVGNGGAEKSQVSFMVSRLLGVKEDWGVDAGDALAAAICHLNSRRMTLLTKR
ncbi:crossover junction endodeoxyribonuclease RuvC [Desulfovibrio litoralis]|uniref:Crossover junction endodeoxyribonuclease RuvC n=1 Tax=Desulfovibrio litoralis DSM 11393 TaxID=1121455 RepID=A0A1M7SQC2_9BACT|nr:crossover junction endodeoxyribonuclease RuvC [Desulfovibrio litoralis]SHN60656.1 Holliday junction endonuclease RuvC [Desulfovibrio litoralis DSM 11393]